MVSTDPISDMLTRIRNAMAVNKPSVSLPHSKTKEDVAELLARNGFLHSVSIKEDEGRKQLEVSINPDGAAPTITEIKRLSRPGRRQYVKAKAIPIIKRGRGIVVVSTSEGVMTDKEARSKNLGGEIICEVY